MQSCLKRPDIPTPSLVNVSNHRRAETSRHFNGLVAKPGELNRFMQRDSTIAKPNQDHSVTLNFGTQPSRRKNFVSVMDDWIDNVRLYQPLEEMVRGEWNFPVSEITSPVVLRFRSGTRCST
ncbi:MAG: hypothetical protein ACJAXA_000888 [Candidatus Aldehydirespiratoraceae bacterium]|jgi:hypothetical protein